MNMNDFVRVGPIDYSHKIYPIVLTIFLKPNGYHGVYFAWFYNSINGDVLIDELKNIDPKDVSQEKISLLLLKYSML